MALFSTFLLSNINSSLLFNYRFPTLDVARPLRYKTKTTYFSRPRPLFQDQDHRFFKLLIQDPKKTFPNRKKSGQSCRFYAGNRKKACLLPAF